MFIPVPRGIEKINCRWYALGVLMRPTSIPSKIKVFDAVHHEYEEIHNANLPQFPFILHAYGCSAFRKGFLVVACWPFPYSNIARRESGLRLRVAQPINVGVFRTSNLGGFKT
jgi:hypothetical protein